MIHWYWVVQYEELGHADATSVSFPKELLIDKSMHAFLYLHAENVSFLLLCIECLPPIMCAKLNSMLEVVGMSRDTFTLIIIQIYYTLFVIVTNIALANFPFLFTYKNPETGTQSEA